MLYGAPHGYICIKALHAPKILCNEYTLYSCRMQQKLYRGIDDLSFLLAEDDVWDPLLLILDNFYFNDSHSIITSSL